MSYPIKFHNYPGILEASGDFAVFDDPNTPEEHLIFQVGETMYFEFNWTQSGWFTNINIPGLSWALDLYFELMGPLETNIEPVLADQPFVMGNGQAYDPPRFMVPTTGATPGTYRVTATVRLKIGGTNLPFAGFSEGPMIEIY